MLRTFRPLVAGLAAAALSLGLVAASTDPASAATPAPRPLVSGWMPYWDTADALASVVGNADLFGDVSPFWYSARGNSPSITVVSQISASSAANAAAALHAKGIKVLPSITDGSGRHDMSAQLATTAGRAHMVSVIVGLVTSKGYDGIDLDWEGFAFSDGRSTWATTRVRWVAFVKVLAAALHARGKLLAVTVPAGMGTSTDSTGYWVYSWSGIGPYVDRLRIMAYDYSVSSAGPIAPFSWVDKVLAKAVTQVSSRKIQIGVPAYGRDWWRSTSGRCPNVAPDSATSAKFFERLAWAKTRHEISARGASSYVSGLFVNEAATIPGIRRTVVPVATWDPVAKEKTFSYSVGFSGRYQGSAVSVVAAAGLAATTTVQIASTADVSVGDAVTGTGIAPGATVTAIGDHALTLSVANTATVSGSLTLVNNQFSAATGQAGQATVRLPAVLPIQVGAGVTGTGVAAGATVVSVATDATGPTPVSVVTLSAPNTAAVAATLSFRLARVRPAVGGWQGGTTVRVLAGTAVSVGSTITGTGIAAGTHVTAVSAHTLTLDAAATGNVVGTLSTTPAGVATTCTVARTGWYGEANSAVAAATLVAKYKLAGIAQWALGGEDTGQWAPLRAYATKIAPLATRVSVSAPARAYIGRRSVLRVTVTSNGAPVAATSVALMFLPSTSTAWRRVGTAITDANGRLVWTTPAATVTGSWRAYVADTWARRAGTAIAAPTVAVKASTAVVLTAPARVAAGTAVRAVTRVSSLGAPVAGVRVYYRWRPAASATWVLLGTNLTNAKGIAVRTYTPRTSGFWKATVAATSTRAGFATVKTVPTVLVPVVTATSKALSVKVGGVATIRATTRPVGAGQAVVVQRRSGATWVAVGVATTDAKGRMATRVPSTRKGTATYRFVVRATANHAAAASASIVVTVV